MSCLAFLAPQQITQHFDVPPDTTAWSGNYRKVKGGCTPEREIPVFRSITGSLTPRTSQAEELKRQYGVYLLAFNVPFPALYVGIAANGSKSPEGILSRFRKHRIKATGSHVGSSPNATGGVHHPQQWQYFARQRHQYFNGRPDILADARFSFGEPEQGCSKAGLEHFEAMIFHNQHEIRSRLIEKLWPEQDHSQVIFLTSKASRLRGDNQDYQISFWGG